MDRTRIAFTILFIAYPIIIFWGLEHFDIKAVSVTVIGVAILRLLLARNKKNATAGFPHSSIIFILLGVGTVAFFSNSIVSLQYYPVLVNLVLLAVFLFSLFRPPTIIERIARIKTPDLSDAGIRYTRKVTIAWCGFFVLNGAMAGYSIGIADFEFWALYNGVIAYSLMGLLFAGEYIIRQVALRRDAF